MTTDLLVNNDIATALDRKCTTILVLLDLSCAYDTINHVILLRRLEHSVGISGAALEWLHSYESERYRQVAVSSAKSSHCILERGVPQGSVLGHLIYCVYTRPIGDIVTRHGLQYHCYDDDTHIYVTVEKDVSRIETCIIEVAAWMAKNNLKLNAEKSQAIIVQPSKHRVNKQPEVCVEIAGHRIALSTSLRNFGVVFDSRLSMEEQVAQTAKSCYYQLRNIGQIRSSITEGACRTLVHALVTSRLDYGNGLYGIPQVTIQRLQRIQNCAARLVTRTRKYEHNIITPVLRRLHWLPVLQRTLFKVLVFTYCALNATAPNYLVQLINHRNVTRTLRSSSSTELLFVPKSRTMMYGNRRFEVASPILWNNLPVSLRTAKCLTQFRSQLKSHLFEASIT